MGYNNKEPEIVKLMRAEEENYTKGSIQDYKEEDKQIFQENNSEETTFENEKTEIHQVADNTFGVSRLNNDSLKKRVNELEEKLKESKERYSALEEYFEIISDRTTSLGKKDLFSDVSDIIFQITPQGRITYINSAVEKITGQSSSSFIGENFSKLIPEKDWIKIKKGASKGFFKNNKNQEVNSFESVMINKENNSVPVEINGKLIRHNIDVLGRAEQYRLQGSIRDISERKHAEEERIKNARRIEEMNFKLKKTNDELIKTQDELRLLNQDLEKKVEERTAEIKKLLKHKIEFIGQLGHDLRTPLTPLIGLIPTIEVQEQDPKLKELLAVVNSNIVYMRDIVVKTLKLERLDSQELDLHFEDSKLTDLINKIIVNKEYIVKEKNLKIKNNLSENLVASVDKLEFCELIDNLLTNAVKYTPEGGNIEFSAKQEEDFLKLSVKDTGIGLSKDQIEHIFEEFYKVDDSRHDLESSGLGLSISQRIVQKHGGKIWVESPGLNKGSTFYVTIPRTRR